MPGRSPAHEREQAFPLRRLGFERRQRSLERRPAEDDARAPATATYILDVEEPHVEAGHEVPVVAQPSMLGPECGDVGIRQPEVTIDAATHAQGVRTQPDRMGVEGGHTLEQRGPARIPDSEVRPVPGEDGAACQIGESIQHPSTAAEDTAPLPEEQVAPPSEAERVARMRRMTRHMGTKADDERIVQARRQFQAGLSHSGRALGPGGGGRHASMDEGIMPGS